MQNISENSINSQKLPLELAPMEGVTDFPFRLWIGLISGRLKTTTPFLRISQNTPKGASLSNWLPEVFAPDYQQKMLKEKVPYSVAPQLMASDIELFVNSALSILDYFEYVEINCGCPAPKAVGKGAGSALLYDIKVFHETISYAAEKLGRNKLRVKIRTGFYDDLAFGSLISGLKNIPLKALVIHGRTRSQKYKGLARWDLINEAALACPFPVIGSGDITSYETLLAKKKDFPNIAGALIGRGAIRNPWIFHMLEQKGAWEIDFEAVIASLRVYSQIVSLWLHDKTLLYKYVSLGIFDTKLGCSKNNWKDLEKELPTPSEKSLILTGRLKLLWHYMRSSFAIPNTDMSVLRSKGIEGFFEAIAKQGDKRYESLVHANPMDKRTLPINYDPSWDSVFGK